MSAEPDASDVSIELNQPELPEEFDEAGLAAIQAGLNSSGLRADVMVVPKSAPRDFIVLPALLAIHFLTAHAVDIVLGVSEGVFWDGIKAAVRRLQPGKAAGQSQRARITVRYKDGPAVEIDVANAGQLRQLLNDIVPPDQRLPKQV